MNIGVSTVVMNLDLFNYSFHTYENLGMIRYLIDGSKGVYGLQALLHQINNKDFDRLVLIDEDMFIQDTELLKQLIDDTLSYDVIGVPDGGMDHRHHNPSCPNNFFVILNTKFIRDRIKALNVIMPDTFKHLVDVNYLNHDKYVYDLFEPYYHVYLNAFAVGAKPFYLKGKNELDDFTTTVYYKDKILGHHTWYARKWKEPEQKERIKKVIKHTYDQAGLIE